MPVAGRPLSEEAHMKTHHWFLVIAVVAILWIFFRGGEKRYEGRRSLDYDRLAVSQGLTAEAAQLDLARDLDVALLPEIGKQAIRDAAQQGLREQGFLEFVIRQVSDRVREISTIDLNGDEIADPILVKPEPQEGEQYVLLSLRVPAHDAYPLPKAGDTAAWKDVETIEVASMSITLDEQALTVQAQGNQHVYPNQNQQHYVARDTTSSFLTMYMGMRMMEWMFFPRMYGFYGPGYGYGFYRPYGVGAIAGQRAGIVSSRNYQRSAPAANSAIRSRGGAAPRSQYSRAFANRAPRSLNQLRSSTRFRQRQVSARSGGFGRTGRGGALSRSAGSFRNRSAVTAGRSVRRSRTFSRSFRRSFGGFGRGGFRFRRCGGCWRGPVPTVQAFPIGAGIVAVVTMP